MKHLLLFLSTVFTSQLLFGQIQVAIISPSNNAVDTGMLPIKVLVQPGEYEIATVIATVESSTDTLSYIGGSFQGAVSLTGLTMFTTYVLSVTATDVMGNYRTVNKNIIIDQPPSLQVQLPINHDVVTSKLHLKTIAHDSLDCKITGYLSLYFNSSQQTIWLDTFMNSLDTLIDLSDSIYQGGYGYVHFTVIDARGQMQDDQRRFYIENSPYLEAVFSTEGIIGDFNYGKVLSYFLGSLPDDNRYPIITDLSTGVKSEIPSTIFDAESGRVYYGLTPTGAIFLGDLGVTEWNNDSLYAVGSANSSSFEVAGSYALWMDEPNLYLRNTTTRSTQLISAFASNSNHGVAANGTAVYWAYTLPNPNDNGIYKYANGISTRIAGGAHPSTDGKNIVYIGGTGIAMFDGTTNINLSTASGSQDDDYRVANGFVAYTKPGTTGQKQIWLRDTTGNSTQITFYSTPSVMRGLGDNGSICFSRNIQNSFLYLYDKNSNKFKALSPNPYNKMYYRDSSWYMSIGRVLFKVKPNFINSYYSVKNGNWSNPATWYGNAVPPVGADVTVGNNVTVDIDATCNTLAVKSNAAVTVNAGINLAVLH